MFAESPSGPLVERWKSGDQSAAQELHRLYSAQLCRLAEQQLDQRLKRRVDGEDVVQSVFRSFFRRTANGEYAIDDSAELWNLLVRITLNKVRDQARHHRAQKRDVAAEAADIEETLIEELAHEPTPEDAAALLDEVETALQGVSAQEANVIRLAMDGYSSSEIASELGCSRWTVRRILNRLGTRISRRLSEISEESSN